MLEATVAAQLALAETGDDDPVVGIGIDYEAWREWVDLRMAKLFLCPHERLHAVDARSLLRLWTVKEALYKATPDNGDAVLLNYQIAQPASRAGVATGPRGEHLRYVSVELDDGQLSLAVCRKGVG